MTESESTAASTPQPGPAPTPESGPAPAPAPASARRPTLDASVRQRRTDQAFFLRITRAMQQHRDALERLR